MHGGIDLSCIGPPLDEIIKIGKLLDFHECASCAHFREEPVYDLPYKQLPFFGAIMLLGAVGWILLIKYCIIFVVGGVGIVHTSRFVLWAQRKFFNPALQTPTHALFGKTCVATEVIAILRPKVDIGFLIFHWLRKITKRPINIVPGESLS